MKPSIGRIVHYVLADGQHRAATVTNAFGGDRANLTVHLDLMNDVEVEKEAGGPSVRRVVAKNNLHPKNMGSQDFFLGVLAVGSAPQDEETKAPGTWHWPERE